MDHFTKLKHQVQLRLLLGMVTSGFIAATLFMILDFQGLPMWQALSLCLLVSGGVGFFMSLLLTPGILEPLSAIWKGVLHVSAEGGREAAPNMDQIKVGRELVTSLLLQVYQLASQTEPADKEDHREKVIQSANIVSHMPLPLFVFNRDQLVTNASDVGLEYCGIDSAALFGKLFYESVKLEFPSDHTLESWIKDCQENKVTDKEYWERVRIIIPGGKDTKEAFRYCDMAAYYNRDNPSGTEFIVALFDKTVRYRRDDRDMNFVSLAVHELRTPLTMLRGYIEVFDEELSSKLDAELSGYMQKMQLAAEQLAAFVNNILNVSRIDENALTLQLSEADWTATLQNIVESMQLKAKVHGMDIQLNIESNLPHVAIDKVSMQEVVNNLVDNAIKYSGNSKRIIISSRLGKDKLVETTVQDFGVGIPASVVPNLFEKFYRNHRTKNQVGGTGLGLFLTKALVNAQGGQVWVSSKEGEGSTFGFSLVPYANLGDELKTGNKEITRTAHGWIKNHSLYRR